MNKIFEVIRQYSVYLKEFNSINEAELSILEYLEKFSIIGKRNPLYF